MQIKYTCINLVSRYASKVFVEHKCISCLKLGFMPKESCYEYANASQSKIKIKIKS